MRKLKRIKKALQCPVEFFFYIKGIFCKKDSLLFLPHPQMCIYDNYNLKNYKSDCTLSFLHFMMSNGFQVKKHIYLIIAETTDIAALEEYSKTTFPKYHIRFLPYLPDSRLSLKKQFINQLRLQNVGCFCSYIFTSRPYSTFNNTASSQKIVNLGYFSAPFKNDIFLPMNNYKQEKIQDGKSYYRFVTVSELARRLIYPTFAVPYDRYVSLGLCRNDYLLDKTDCRDLRDQLLSCLPYKADKILLYTPTHRDHFDNGIGIAKSILGFDMDLQIFDNFLQQEKIFIICKLHPKYHPSALNKNLPASIRVHSASSDYGLTELMKVSDALMTDYTSGYFDYLLMDKPVIFNFFDYEEYRNTRGFTFEPIFNIVAGDVVKDSNSMLEALLNIDESKIKYREKRAFVRDLIFEHIDTHSCERVYQYFFGKDK